MFFLVLLEVEGAHVAQQVGEHMMGEKPASASVQKLTVSQWS